MCPTTPRSTAAPGGGWVKGVARAPASWTIELQISCFLFYGTSVDAAMHLEDSEVFTLEDARADMTISSLLTHVTTWMFACPASFFTDGLATTSVSATVVARVASDAPRLEQDPA